MGSTWMFMNVYVTMFTTPREKSELAFNILAIHFIDWFHLQTLCQFFKRCSSACYHSCKVRTCFGHFLWQKSNYSPSRTGYGVLNVLHCSTGTLDHRLLYKQEWSRSNSRTGQWTQSHWWSSILKGSSTKIICRMVHMSITSVYAKFEMSCTEIDKSTRQTVKYWAEFNLLRINTLC